MATQVLFNPLAETSARTTFRRIIVAHDFSLAADRALDDAMALARQFHSEIVIVHIETIDTVSEHLQTRDVQQQATRIKLDEITRRVALAGHTCTEILRTGSASSTLIDLGYERAGDLLMVGAFGNSSAARDQNCIKLGSTAEAVLRSTPCPVLIYGPDVHTPLLQRDEPFSILLALDLPCSTNSLAFALTAARLFGAHIEVLHVENPDQTASLPHAAQDRQYLFDEVLASMRRAHADVSGSLVFGDPPEAILARARMLASSIILMPLEARGQLTSPRSDNVAAAVIRSAEVPVMTYRVA